MEAVADKISFCVEDTDFAEAMEFAPFSERGKAPEVRDRRKEAQHLEETCKAYATLSNGSPTQPWKAACGSSWNGLCRGAPFRLILLEGCRSSR